LQRKLNGETSRNFEICCKEHKIFTQEIWQNLDDESLNQTTALAKHAA